jgi:predicted DNA-binding transcriptional regulator AlpA
MSTFRRLRVAEQLLHIEEVAHRLRTPVSTLRDWRRRGIGPKSTRIGRRLVYRETEVTDWLLRQFEATPGGGAA